MNVKELRAEMVRHGIGMSDMAKYLGIGRSTLYKKWWGIQSFCSLKW